MSSKLIISFFSFKAFVSRNLGYLFSYCYLHETGLYVQTGLRNDVLNTIGPEADKHTRAITPTHPSLLRSI
jgi:hypothetical protein